MKLLVQDFLATKTFGELKSVHGVEVSFHSTGHKFNLNYSQLESKNDDPLAQECRGLILAMADGRSLKDQAKMVNGRLNYDHLSPGKTIIIAYSFKRFFNAGQDVAAEIDWAHPNLNIHEKLDGTLAIVYYDTVSRQWCMATRSVPEADLPMADGRTYFDLFDNAMFATLKLFWCEFCEKLDPNLTYAFELTTPFNEIVVKHKESRIHFLTARDLRTHKELRCSDPQFDWLPKPKAFSLNNLNAIVEYVNSRSVQEQEGVVVKQEMHDAGGSFLRIKIKHPDHGLYSRAREQIGGSERNQLQLIIEEKDDDVMPYLADEIAERVVALKNKFVAWKARTENLFKQIKQLTNEGDGTRKTFALLAQKATSYPYPLYTLWTGGSIGDYIKSGFKNDCWSSSFLENLLKDIKREI
jgi:hypothetical protein